LIRVPRFCAIKRKRKREVEVVNWGERERTEMLIEYGVGFKRRSTLVDFDQWSKSTQKCFWISQMAISTQRYFETV